MIPDCWQCQHVHTQAVFHWVRIMDPTNGNKQRLKEVLKELQEIQWLLPNRQHEEAVIQMASSAWPVSYTCASGSFWSGRTCMSSPSTATRCPCLGSAVSGPYEPLLLPPCRAARRLLPAGSCARRWTWWRERGAAWAGQPCSLGNLSWRQVRREQEKGGERAGETTERRGEEGWQQGAEAAVTWKRRAKRESEAWKVKILWRIHITYCCHISTSWLHISIVHFKRFNITDLNSILMCSDQQLVG